MSDRLADRFGNGQVFMDVDSIGPGVDFAEEISRAVAGCQVLLAVIGPNWLTAADQRGRHRLDNPDDLVRLEVEAALDRGMLVIPILVEGAVMPERDDLPASLAGLARRNALRIRHETFRDDVGHLVTAIEQVLAATDPDRAARLFTDAKRIAKSVLGKHGKASALGGVATALAATDPNRAERIASSITHKHLKASALSRAAMALAATDPDRAEHIARSINDKSWKSSALSDIATALTAISP